MKQGENVQCREEACRAANRKMKEKLYRFMQGRYGQDNLNRFLLGVILFLMIIDIFIPGNVLYLIGFALLIYTYYRIFSRNIPKRYRENQWYLGKTAGIRGFFQKKKRLRQMKKTYYICRCRGCKQQIRLPKGKKLEVTCPKCGKVFEVRT